MFSDEHIVPVYKQHFQSIIDNDVSCVLIQFALKCLSKGPIYDKTAFI